MTGLEILVSVRPEKRREFLVAIEALSTRETRLADLHSIEVFEQHGRPNHFLWVERWISEAMAEERRNSDAFHALLGAIKVLGHLEKMSLVRAEEPDLEKE